MYPNLTHLHRQSHSKNQLNNKPAEIFIIQNPSETLIDGSHAARIIGSENRHLPFKGAKEKSQTTSTIRKKQVDDLYKNVNEFKQTPDDQLIPLGTRYIDIEFTGGRYSLLATIFKLSSGVRVYVTSLMGKQIISDGEIYYIDNIVAPPPASLFSQIFQLLAQLINVVQVSIPVFTRATHTAQTPVVMTTLDSNARVIHMPNVSAHGVMTQRSSDRGRDPSPYPFTAAVPFLTRKRRNTDNQHDVEASKQPDHNTVFSHSSLSLEKASLLKYCACLSNFDLPSEYAKKTLMTLVQDYSATLTQALKEQNWLNGFDYYLGKLIKHHIDHALYFKEKRKTLTIILIKRYVEIENSAVCKKNPSQTGGQCDIDPKFDHPQFFLEKYFNFNENIVNVFKEINLRVLNEVIVIKNHKSYTVTKTHLQKMLSSASKENEKVFFEYYTTLILMEKAHHHFRRHVQHHSSTKGLRKILFENNLHLWYAIINKNMLNLKQTLLSRFFYYIFHYNMIHNDPYDEENLIIPGEFTPHWQIFVIKKQQLEFKSLDDIFQKQLIDYFQHSLPPNTHLTKIIKLIEYSRTKISTSTLRDDWQADSLAPYRKAKDILEKNILINLDVDHSIGELSHDQWHADSDLLIKYNKECQMLLQYLATVQKEFNKALISYSENNIVTTAETPVQFLVNAKISAVNHLVNNENTINAAGGPLPYYLEKIKEGDIDFFIYAACYWFMATHQSTEKNWRDLDAFSILKSFKTSDELEFNDFRIRRTTQYTSVFNLKTSATFNDTDSYFDQFAEYEFHDMHHEAKNMTAHLVMHSLISFRDLISPLQEIFTFRIFSRHYIHNTLVPQVWVSTPKKNYGFIIIMKTQSGNTYLASTLLSAPFIIDITKHRDNALYKRIIDILQKTNFNVNVSNREKTPLTYNELSELLSLSSDDPTDNLLNFIVHPPKKNIFSNPQSDFSLVADINNMRYSSPLAALDHWYKDMLLEISQDSADILVDHNWVDYLTSLIPFYEVIWRYWHDQRYEIRIKDILLDSFDLTCSLVPAGVGIIKLNKITLSKIISLAKENKIKPSKFNYFLLQKILKKSATALLDNAIIINNELISFLNPNPLQKLFNRHIFGFVNRKVLNEKSWLRHNILDNEIKIATMKKSWAIDIEKIVARPNENGIFESDMETMYRECYVKIDNIFYSIIFDKTINRWRIVNPRNTDKFDGAIPIIKNQAGQWHSAAFHDPDPISPLTGIGMTSADLYSGLNIIQFEPLTIIKDPEVLNDEVVYLTKRKLQLFFDIYQPYINDCLAKKIPEHDIIKIIINGLITKKGFDKIPFIGINPQIKKYILSIVDSFEKNDSVTVSYRVNKWWVDEQDINPIDHLVIKLNIDDTLFIIDLLSFRPDTGLKGEQKQFFLEHEWLTYYDINIPIQYGLVKFVDYEKINSAIDFSLKVAITPTNYIKEAMLIREPIWYKTSLIKSNLNYFNNAVSPDYQVSPTVLSAARNIIIRTAEYDPHPGIDAKKLKFPFLILEKAELITLKMSERSKSLMDFTPRIKIPLEAYFGLYYEVKWFKQLLDLEQGVLLAFISLDGMLHHLMICLGLGRFAAQDNGFFNPQLSARPSIITAEEMGVFSQGTFQLRGIGGPYKLFIGITDTSIQNKVFIPPNQLLDPPLATTMNGDDFTNYDNYFNRFTQLLGDRWEIRNSVNMDHCLIIKMQAVPHNARIIHGMELANIVRGLSYYTSFLSPLSTVSSIQLISCYSLHNGIKPLGQVLADELLLTVESIPYYSNDAIRQRHPEWYTVYTPQSANSNTIKTADDEIDYIKMRNELKITNSRLNLLLKALASIKQNVNNRRKKRSIQDIPEIFINIALTILGDSISAEDFIAYLPSATDRNTFNKIKLEYNINEKTSNEIFFQCFFDIVSYIDDLKYRANWFQYSKENILKSSE
ncbi:hypothetical protein SJI19_12395 [Acerihabitans sp. TG2]|uniref:hypothetical protein n=1 Tax=Acerihabitans sp. TG2 TaxID=3096008 RepID=UPI002B232A42|nr:hypothetical protein [Acerihabitans sp. TG2]MEA9391331.1 hypothetical protein [Acerihabitans sp. TG2]